jgi:hypothetical protein
LENLNKAVSRMAEKLIPEIAARQMAKELLEEFGITAGLKKRFPKQPEQAEELIEEYGKYYWQLRDILRKPPEQRRGGFRGLARREEE